MDQIEAALDRLGAEAPAIEVFDVLDCESMGDFEKFIPGIGEVFCTPVLGVFIDGNLIDHADGLSEVIAVLRRFHVLDEG